MRCSSRMRRGHRNCNEAVGQGGNGQGRDEYVVISKWSDICCSHTYVTHIWKPRTQERQRGTADPRARQDPCPPWLRYRETDRGTLGRRADLPCRLALSSALPARDTRLDRRPVGGETRNAETPDVSHYARGPESAGRATERLAGIRPSRQPRCGSRACLSGGTRSG